MSSTKSQIVAIELLTENITTEDLDGSHVDLNLNGYLKREKPFSVNISAGKDVEVRVESDGEALRVFVGKNKSILVISDSLSLSYSPSEGLCRILSINWRQYPTKLCNVMGIQCIGFR